ncbi:hypothetical protein GCM10017562_04390 [Streptomyces roseofulvus]
MGRFGSERRVAGAPPTPAPGTPRPPPAPRRPLALRRRTAPDHPRGPRLPARHLPADRPARAAQETFRRAAVRTEEPALAMARELPETVRLPRTPAAEATSGSDFPGRAVGKSSLVSRRPTAVRDAAHTRPESPLRAC